jgi:phenylalanine-4-hydroxylase
MREEPKDRFPRDNGGYYIYDIASTHLSQDYEKYTPEDHQVWRILYERQMKNLPGKVTEAYLQGIEQIKFVADHIPNFEETNQILNALTGWRVYVVPGLIPTKEFFELMRDRNFCATTWLRTMQQLDYLEEPDMFHDVFGHVPLLTNQNLCDFLVNLSKIALKHIDSPIALEAIARIYWFTVEFGLIQEPEGLRIYGAGIVSSSGETEFSLFSPVPERIPFEVKTLINTPYRKDAYQERYFVIDSFEQLYNSIEEIEKEIDALVENELVIAM